MLDAQRVQEDIPYFPISRFYKEKFGQKVFKVPVALAGDCPNRAGLKGMKTCIFCDEHGSFAYPKSQQQELRDQIELHREKVAERFKSKKFLVYFQAYTTTFTHVQKLREAFDVALEYPDTVGIVIGTRPDCLSAGLYDLLNAYQEKTFISVELGLQSFDNKQLEWMRRGHTREQSIKGIQRLQKKCPQVNLGVHLMFGWPGESDADILESARYCNELGVDNVKLHNLHVLKGTPLAKMYENGEFQPIERDAYCRWVGLFLQHLSPKIPVHRLVAIASRWDELVAPLWTRYKMTNYQYMLSYLKDHKLYQGQCFNESH